MGHIGWTPQAINAWAARSGSRARPASRLGTLLADALAVQEAGAFAVVLELVPGQLAAAITERLHDPDDRHRRGAGCSGQIQVITDTARLGRLARRGTPGRTRTCGGRSSGAVEASTRPTSRPARSRPTRRPC